MPTDSIHDMVTRIHSHSNPVRDFSGDQRRTVDQLLEEVFALSLPDQLRVVALLRAKNEPTEQGLSPFRQAIVLNAEVRNAERLASASTRLQVVGIILSVVMLASAFI